MNRAHEFSTKDFSDSKELASMQSGRDATAYCEGNVYVFGGFNEMIELVPTAEKYSYVTNEWVEVSEVSGDQT